MSLIAASTTDGDGVRLADWPAGTDVGPRFREIADEMSHGCRGGRDLHSLVYFESRYSIVMQATGADASLSIVISGRRKLDQVRD